MAGRMGARVTYKDGTRVDYPPYALVRVDETVRSLVGRLYRVRPGGGLAYEAPELAPTRRGRMTRMMREEPKPPQPPQPGPTPPEDPEEEGEELPADEEDEPKEPEPARP